MPLSWISSGSESPGLRTFSHEAMKCNWDIVVPQVIAAQAEPAARAAFEEIDRLEQDLSRFIEHSDIARINDAAAGEHVRIGPAAFDCLDLAQRLHQKTGGAFDVTIGAALSQRDHAPVEFTPDTPIGMSHLYLDRERRTAVKELAALKLDLGAIGKGYAVDQAVDVLRDWKISAALVHSGQSTVFALGEAREGRPWSIAVRNPADHAAVIGRVTLRDAALSGSGVLLHGRHIIDPRSGRPGDIRAGAWAIAPMAAESDAVSTAFMLMSEEQVRAYCERNPSISALLHTPSGAGVSLAMYGTIDLEIVA